MAATTTASPARQGRHSAPALLAVYLNDHLAGATGGVELARRVAGQHRGSPDGERLTRLAAEIAEDRDALTDIMSTLDVRVRRYKVCAGWAAERLGRLKPNRALVRRSPLSSLLELEAIRLGVEGKAALWRTLLRLPDGFGLDRARLETLERRAGDQAGVLQELHARQAPDVFGGARD
ncbi:hypothetical protein V1J52_10095 [Streptomyces sp. TRM 70351]|uniref:hypothetical protein n=1 Tax=Streptomyces sp. TRM 70351 TaxID=3116552 RepID=UPI002E7C5505|nr:hypothetical protein [Streptomyces sp. TRM 70351]MEE1928539.1 hypothetical protein [Streptomyces sp. TRM 70351]